MTGRCLFLRPFKRRQRVSTSRVVLLRQLWTDRLAGILNLWTSRQALFPRRLCVCVLWRPGPLTLQPKLVGWRSHNRRWHLRQSIWKLACVKSRHYASAQSKRYHHVHCSQGPIYHWSKGHPVPNPIESRLFIRLPCVYRIQCWKPNSKAKQQNTPWSNSGPSVLHDLSLKSYQQTILCWLDSVSWILCSRKWMQRTDKSENSAKRVRT